MLLAKVRTIHLITMFFYSNDIQCKSNLNVSTQVTISCIAINVGGLKSKTLFPDFEQFIRTYDVVCISESKLSNSDQFDLKGFTTFYKNRKKFKRKSGGILILIRNWLVNYVSIYEEEKMREYIDKKLIQHYVFVNHELSKRILFFSFDTSVFGESTLFGAVYIEPENSDYFDRNAYNEIEMSILNLNMTNICLLGDFNSRTGQLDDLLEINNFNDTPAYDYDFIMENRTSKDNYMNNMGHEMIQFLKTCQLAIVNGRIGRDKGEGKLTCKNASLVDYSVLSYYDMFNIVTDFYVNSYNELYSDCHCAIQITFQTVLNDATVFFDQSIELQDDIQVYTENKNNYIVKWNNDNANKFIEYLNVEAMEKIDTLACKLSDNDTHISSSELDTLVYSIGELFIDAAKHADMIKTKHKHKINSTQKKNKPWFNVECRHTRKLFLKAKRHDKKINNIQSNMKRKAAAKTYKKTVKKYFRRYKIDLANKIRFLRVNDPKSYWNILKNAQTTNKCNVNNNSYPSCNAFFDMFQKLGKGDPGDQLNENKGCNCINFINTL